MSNDSVPAPIRILMWSYLVSQLQALNWIVDQKEASGTEVPENLRIVQNYLRSIVEDGPDSEGSMPLYRSALEITDEITSGKPHLEVIDGGQS